MKKRIISCLLVLCMIISIIPTTIFAASVIANGTCGEALTWVLTNDGALTISGKGAIDDYQATWYDEETSTTTAPWFGYADQINAIVIEEGITRI